MTGFNWSGNYGRGYMRERRAQKRAEAEQRNERTAPERRRAYRREAA